MNLFISTLIDPAALLWLLLLVLGLWMLVRRNWRCSLVMLAVGVGWWALEVTGAPGRLLSSLERPYLDTGSPGRADAIIVLGGGASWSEYEFAKLDFGLAADRVLTAAELSRRGLGKVLVLGGSATVEPEVAPEPERLRRWLESWEVVRTPILDLGACRNTRDEAVRAAELGREHGWGRVLLVTSASHMKRSVAAFRAVGMDVEPVGCDFAGMAAVARGTRWMPQSSSMVLLQLWLHEVVGMWYYRARGWG